MVGEKREVKMRQFIAENDEKGINYHKSAKSISNKDNLLNEFFEPNRFYIMSVYVTMQYII